METAMKQVIKMVPMDADARVAAPMAELSLTDGKLPLRAVEKMAMAKGWIRLSLLSKREKKRWLEANRRAHAAAKKAQLEAPKPAEQPAP